LTKSDSDLHPAANVVIITTIVVDDDSSFVWWLTLTRSIIQAAVVAGVCLQQMQLLECDYEVPCPP
jgi:hypothetical protein